MEKSAKSANSMVAECSATIFGHRAKEIRGQLQLACYGGKLPPPFRGLIKASPSAAGAKHSVNLDRRFLAFDFSLPLGLELEKTFGELEGFLVYPTQQLNKRERAA